MEFLGINFDKDLREISTKSLAYVGDSVFELFCRMNYSFNNKEVVTHVNARAQARYFEKIESALQEDERAVALRGRNLKSPRSKDPFYRKATAFESVVGYLFLKGKTERLTSLLKMCVEE
ncbi:Mini-ribonuclease 3 [Mesoaciditoga lauensis]|uniref:Mini-ribonuclease 3 n=1 Tax=Mesoaciditoga lauensis TaxID=1495039 RepID=UPI00068BDACC|nr:ribonuclease III domain-containing protein [Mesoaciditoga lauensis]